MSPDECRPSIYSSRACEMGTNGCDVQHSLLVAITTGHNHTDDCAWYECRLIARAEAAEKELMCWRATRGFLPLSLREALERGDSEAVRADAQRGIEFQREVLGRMHDAEKERDALLSERDGWAKAAGLLSAATAVEAVNLRKQVEVLESDCSAGDCRACVKCHDARERERDAALARVEELKAALSDTAQAFDQTHENHCTEPWTSRRLHHSECLKHEADAIRAALKGDGET